MVLARLPLRKRKRCVAYAHPANHAAKKSKMSLHRYAVLAVEVRRVVPGEPRGEEREDVRHRDCAVAVEVGGTVRAREIRDPRFPAVRRDSAHCPRS